jgi:recombination endonuclease VII
MAASSPARVKRRVCKEAGDDPAHQKRPAPHAGPRCATCHRAVKAARRTTAHGLYVLKTYGITEDEYWALYELQGGRCYICQRATGRSKRLAVDHDHACCPETPACGRCVRGLLCRSCNRDVLGHLRDDVEALRRAIDYLTNPPAKRVIYRDEAA